MYVCVCVGFEVFVTTDFDILLSYVVCSVETYIHRTAYH
jgi:hypothetical protein